MNKNLKATVITIATATVLGGCASQTTTETGFGNAVREVTMKQTYDIGATLESEPEATVGADPYQLSLDPATAGNGKTEQESIHADAPVNNSKRPMEGSAGRRDIAARCDRPARNACGGWFGTGLQSRFGEQNAFAEHGGRGGTGSGESL
jgi:hypothetical protein